MLQQMGSRPLSGRATHPEGLERLAWDHSASYTDDNEEKRQQQHDLQGVQLLNVVSYRISNHCYCWDLSLLAERELPENFHLLRDSDSVQTFFFSISLAQTNGSTCLSPAVLPTNTTGKGANGSHFRWPLRKQTANGSEAQRAGTAKHSSTSYFPPDKSMNYRRNAFPAT